MLDKRPHKYVSVVIPVYNEEDNVIPLTKKIDDSLNGLNYEIIFVDDFSKDNTKKNIISMNNPNIILIELRKNYGQSLALAAGFDYAKGDFIVTLDGDMQNDPSDIPHMIEKAKNEDWDVVTGVRVKRKDSLVRKLPSKIANFLIRKATQLDLKDQGCAIKVFKKDTAKDLNLYGEMHRFINLLAYLNGAKITQTPVKHHPRLNGKSKYGLNRTVKVINDLILILFQRKYLQRPVHLFGNFGLFFLFIGLVINLYLLVLKFLGYDIGGRPLLIVGVIFIIISLQFFTVGIIADLLMRTYYESQNKRPYAIRKIHISEYKNN
ncbi:glycosyltransferase family 2 protein [Tenacibaculum caenipelagi]|uniref:Glycosyltransferase involved in cell wall biosynthesis n=1 Tax=Tenacibaculum caenipelagi TaxID=1325435 RepID=A0A4R6TEB4_9FLAO|nr:glycosyltransferase family 2 protein [Tenacibaculum caenipelagi]TDQ24117.1 glycosyltransferase involved in cell wall biosynthesis [Tenacibaculum caenipelagi]